MKWSRMFLLVAAVAVFAWSGIAQSAGTMQLKSEVFQDLEVKGPDGKVELKTVPAAIVVPGTEVTYVVTYDNQAAEPAEKVVITNPVPKELEYLSASSVEGKILPEVSIDGGKQYGDLAALKVKEKDGRLRPAAGSDVTHVRWVLKSPVKSGEKGQVSFRARLK